MNDERTFKEIARDAILVGRKLEAPPRQETDYYASLLVGLRQSYSHSAALCREVGDERRACFYQAKADAMNEAYQHYRELAD